MSDTCESERQSGKHYGDKVGDFVGQMLGDKVGNKAGHKVGKFPEPRACMGKRGEVAITVFFHRELHEMFEHGHVVLQYLYSP